jgi:hypothetical protein
MVNNLRWACPLAPNKMLPLVDTLGYLEAVEGASLATVTDCLFAENLLIFALAS